MAEASTIIDLAQLQLAYGEGRRLELPVRLEPLELGGQTYVVSPDAVDVRLDVSRPSGGFAFRLRFPLRIEGPCMRCLEGAAMEAEVDAREVAHEDTEDEELRSPYVSDDELAIPAQFLCRPDCAGLCPVCGESLNDADPSDHEHEPAPDPRWAKLKELRLK
jgi:uncharacterized protein